MIFEAIINLNILIYNTLDGVFNLNKPQRDFFIEIMLLFLSIQGRMNFLQFGRFGKFGEQRYRQQFEKPFNFMDFNKNITLNHGSGHFVIAFDPSYISKSGKETPGVDKFWSSVAGAAKFGLEIGGIAAIDIENKTAFHLEAVQTPTYEDINKKDMTLLDWYADIIIQRNDSLSAISKQLVVDAYFSKKPFVDKINSSVYFYNTLIIRRLYKANNKY